jgi:hypothetical protein
MRTERRGTTVKARYFIPLAGLSADARDRLRLRDSAKLHRGWNELTLGFAATVVGAVATYLAGIGVVLRDLGPRS